jgi:hypothetical protein
MILSNMPSSYDDRLAETIMNISEKKHGAVAILDALGAANYEDSEITEFLKSRQVVLRLLNDKSESVAQSLDVARVKTYTFSDTMLIILESVNEKPAAEEIQAFVTVLRKLLVDSLKRHIIFRGSFAIGEFYEDSSTNTILGKAVTDAAAWYDKADWIGILATPRTTIYLSHLMEDEKNRLTHLLVDYNVPLIGGESRRLWSVNWPKIFWIKSSTPYKSDEKPRESFLYMLSRFSVPRGTESKFFNAISFFDYVMKKFKLKNRPLPTIRVIRRSIKHPTTKR